jgi:di/tricarboxylate transporter
VELLADMGWEAWLTLVVVAGVTVTMALERLGPDLAMFAALCVLVVAGVVEPRRALNGFSQPAVATIAVLLIVAGAVRDTGALKLISSTILGKSTDKRVVLLRLVVPTAFMSAFLNNTPIVAMFIPMVRAHARKIGENPSRLLIPLSYAAMFGGTCTLMGTSANLVVSGMLAEHGFEPMGIVEIGKIGLPTSLIGIAYLATIGRRLIPDREDPIVVAQSEARDYLVELAVASDSPLVGSTVEDAGLRALPELFLVELRRGDGRVFNPVAPEMVLKKRDHLVFTGVADSVEDLISQFPGLQPANDDHEVEEVMEERQLFEVVISHRSPLVGRTVKESDFRRRFDAAILAVHRSGERLQEKIGDIEFQPGDTLILSASPGFRRSWQNSVAFYLVSEMRAEPPRQYRRARIVLATAVGMVLVPALTGAPLLVAAMGALVLLLGTQCITLRTARASVNWTVLVLIGSAFGVAAAMDVSGAADGLAAILIRLTEPLGPRATLAAVYVFGVAMASFISNAAAAALLFPVAITAAELGGHDAKPFAIALAMAASAGFSTPIGCAPNLLIYGPGGYRYLDFTRVGLPLNVVFAAVAVVGIPLIWPFTG